MHSIAELLQLQGSITAVQLHLALDLMEVHKGIRFAPRQCRRDGDI